MAQLPYELMDMIRNGGQPALAGGQQLPYALLDPIQSGGMPVLYQPKPSRIIPGMVSPFAPIAEPQAGDIPDQRARAQRYMRGQETPVAANATDFPVQQGALYRPGDETLMPGSNGESTAQTYAQTLLDSGQNYPNGMPQPWNRPTGGAIVPDSGPATLMGAQTDSPDMPRQMPASPGVGIPQPSIAFNQPQESGVAGNNYTSGSTTSNPQQGALAQPQQQPESNAMMMGLLAAGLGILANNSGNYGAAGPAIGKGGLMGVQTYLQQKQQELAQQNLLAQQTEQKRLHDAQILNYHSEVDKRKTDVLKEEQQIQAQKDLMAGTKALLSRMPAEAQVSSTLATPGFQRDLAALMLSSGNMPAYKIAMEQADKLEEAAAKHRQVVQIPTGANTEHPAVVDMRNGSITDIPGVKDRNIHNPESLVKVSVDTGPKAFWTEYGNIAAKSLGQQHDMAQGAATGITQLHEARRILDQGIISGSGADFKLALGKGLKAVGFDSGGDAASNTEAFAASMGRQVGELVKMFGAGVSISNADRDFAEKMAGGKINLEEKSIRRIMDISERAYRSAIDRYNTSITEVQNHPMAANLPKASMTVTSPPAYSGPQTQQTPQQQQNNKHWLYDPKTKTFKEQ